MTPFPILELKSGRERSILNRHPWIFSGAVKTLPQAENGDIIEVQDNHHHILGYGFFSPESQIVCRIFEFSNKIQIKEFKEEYWFEKIKAAFDLRSRFVISAATNAYRLLHAEGDFIPGVIVDVYNETAVMQLLIKGTENIYPFFVNALKKLGIKHIYLKNKQNTGFLENVHLENNWLTESSEDNIMVNEHQKKFHIDIIHGQKTGFFIDQRENRLLVEQYSKDKSVLNAFSYTGGFSVYALAGGAKEVHSVDASRDAIAIGEKNITLNFGETKKHQSFTVDCFEYLRSVEQIYDLIILDPPAFAKNAKSVPNASRGYKDLNLLGFKKIKPGGIMFTFSCSGNIDKTLFRQIVFAAAADSHRNIRILHQLTQPVDHPINIYHPEGEYLKGLVLYVE